MKKSIVVLAPGVPKEKQTEFEKHYKHSLLCKPKDPSEKIVVNFFYDHQGPTGKFHHPVKGLIIEPSLSSNIKDLTSAHRRLTKDLKPEMTFMFQNGHDMLPGCIKVSDIKEVKEFFDQA